MKNFKKTAAFIAACIAIIFSFIFSSCHQFDDLVTTPDQQKCQDFGFTDCNDFSNWYLNAKYQACGVKDSFSTEEPFSNKKWRKAAFIIRKPDQSVEIRSSNFIFSVRRRQLPLDSTNQFRADYAMNFLELPSDTSKKGGVLKEKVINPYCQAPNYFYLVTRRSSAFLDFQLDVLTFWGDLPNLVKIQTGEKIEGVFLESQKGYVEEFSNNLHVIAAFFHFYSGKNEWQDTLNFKNLPECPQFMYDSPEEIANMVYSKDEVKITHRFRGGFTAIARMYNDSLPETRKLNLIISTGNRWLPGFFSPRTANKAVWTDSNQPWLAISARRCTR